MIRENFDSNNLSRYNDRITANYGYEYHQPHPNNYHPHQTYNPNFPYRDYNHPQQYPPPHFKYN
jgi:hypothetical protein